MTGEEAEVTKFATISSYLFEGKAIELMQKEQLIETQLIYFQVL